MEGVKRITALFARLIFDKEYFTVAQPTSASVTPSAVKRQPSLGRDMSLMEQGNATHSGKVWENIQPEKESMEYS